DGDGHRGPARPGRPAGAVPQRHDLAAAGGHEARRGHGPAGASGGADAGMKILDLSSMDAAARAAALARPGGGDQAAVEAAVRRVFEQVQADGDVALRALTRRFDGVELGRFEVTDEEFAEAEAAVTPALRAAMAEARERLLAWHRAGAAQGFEIETAPGVNCGRMLRPIARVGLYVPAGSAPLPSTALMLG